MIKIEGKKQIDDEYYNVECKNFTHFSENLQKYNNKLVMRKGITINCVFNSKPEKLQVILDSGATTSLVTEIFVEKFAKNKIVRKPTEGKQANTAGGGKLQLANYTVSFDIPCKDYTLKFVDAVVARSEVWNVILFGWSDLLTNDIDLKTKNGKIVKLNLYDKPISPQEFVDLYNFQVPNYLMTKVPDNFYKKGNKSSQYNNPPLNEKVTLTINNAPMVKSLTKSNSLDSVFIEEKINTKSAILKNPDGEKKFWVEIERLKSEMLKVNTKDDVSIDPKNEVLDLSKPEDEDFKNAILRLIDKNQGLFRGDAGNVADERYIVTGTIRGTLLGKTVPNYYAKMPPHILQAVREKFNTEIAAGVLKRLPKGVTPAHILPIFAVSKKDDDGGRTLDKNGKVIINTSNVRLVADCNRGLNFATEFKATQVDNIKTIIQAVTPYTVKGLICILDVSQMFYSFNLEEKLHRYFCIEHPDNGIFCYRVLPMGWIQAPSSSRQFLQSILYAHKNYLYRYLDDICIVGNTRSEFLRNLEAVLQTLVYFNFRLKGKKMSVLGTSIDLLGKTLVKGVIKASKHIIQNINNRSYEAIITKRQLKSFIGCVSYISDHLPRQADLLAELRTASTGTLADKVVWTPDLIQNLGKVKTVCDGLLDLHPILPDQDLYMVVDSSIFATGMFLYQIDPDNPKKKRFVKIFSRRRSNADNKFSISSCQMELNGIVVSMVASSLEISYCKKRVIIFTDSQPVAHLYKRLRDVGTPSADKCLNDCFAKLMVYDYEIRYLSNKEQPILAADYISRNYGSSEICNDKDCRVCKSVNCTDDLFFNHVETLCKAVSEMPYEKHDHMVISYKKYNLLQRTILTDPGATYTHPFGNKGSGFTEFTKTDDSLKELQIYNSEIRYLLRMKTRGFDPNLSLHDILQDIENCPGCYVGPLQNPLDWFTQACDKIHPIVWGKIAGYPVWPGKALGCSRYLPDTLFFSNIQILPFHFTNLLKKKKIFFQKKIMIHFHPIIHS